MTVQDAPAKPNTRRRWIVGGIVVAILAVAIGAGIFAGMSAQSNPGTDRSGSVVHNGGDMCGQVTCDEFQHALNQDGQ